MRIANLLSGDISRYNPRNNQSQFQSSVTPKFSGTGVAGDFVDAITKGVSNYKDTDGEIVHLVPTKVPGVKNTYVFRQMLEKERGRRMRNSTNKGNREETEWVSTQGYSPSDIEDKKYALNNRRNQETHHMMGLDDYANFLDPQSIDENGLNIIMQELAKNGFFPGNDRRNYIGLTRKEHQSDIHKRLNKLRQEYPMPTPYEISNYLQNPHERLAVMLEHLVRDRGQLQAVIANQRRPGARFAQIGDVLQIGDNPRVNSPGGNY